MGRLRRTGIEWRDYRPPVHHVLAFRRRPCIVHQHGLPLGAGLPDRPGPGRPGAAGQSAEDRQVPGRPDAPTVTPGDGQLTVAWTAPDDHGYSITRYWVQYQQQGSGSWVENRNAWKIDTGGVPSYTIPNLGNNHTYNMQVKAQSYGGTGDWSASATGAPAQPNDYDSDDDGLIDVDSLAKLIAIRWEMDGNGAADDSANAASYAASPNPEDGMGCPETRTSYELEVDLDFHADGSGAADSGDPYWDEGKGWRPIGGLENADYDTGFNATFDGGGHTISNLFINREWTSGDEWAGYRVALFGVATKRSAISNLTWPTSTSAATKKWADWWAPPSAKSAT